VAAAAGGPAALHLGCSVGGTTFELSSSFGSVTGLDSSESAIRHARILQHHGQFEFERVTEGVLTESASVAVRPALQRSRVTFVHGDATLLAGEGAAGRGQLLGLAPGAPAYDAVLVDRLLTFCVQPLEVIKSLPGLVRPGGLLVISSSNDWKPATTPRNSWLGGFKMNGEDQTTLRMLQFNLKRAFELLETRSLPRSSQANDRRICLDIMQVSVWRRRA
jgi:SAM-dependent methyltransferase